MDFDAWQRWPDNVPLAADDLLPCGYELSQRYAWMLQASRAVELAWQPPANYFRVYAADQAFNAQIRAWAFVRWVRAN